MRGAFARPLARDREGSRRRAGGLRALPLAGFEGTHAIGHVRMATQSDVDISGAHPYWAYPFSDVAVVHNGQLTNYFQWKRRLEASGHRFQSECDSRDHRGLPRGEDGRGGQPQGRDGREPRGPRRRVHVHGGHAGQPRGRQGRDGGEAARPVRVRRARRDGLGGDRDPRADRSRDRHVRSRTKGRCWYGAGSGVGRPPDDVRRPRPRRTPRRGPPRLRDRRHDRGVRRGQAHDPPDQPRAPRT